jgi:hypothetical protein
MCVERATSDLDTVINLVFSPDISLLDFYLWGSLKLLVYADNVQSVAHLWKSIIGACNTIAPDTIHRVISGWIPRMHLCISHNDGHIEHILWIQAVYFTLCFQT